MPAKTKFDPDVTIGELLFLLKLGEIQREDGVEGAFTKFRDQTGQSRDTVRSTFARIQDAVGGLDIASKDGGRIGISEFGHNVGRVGWIAYVLINIAKAPGTDQTKLLALIDGIREEIIRRDQAGDI